MDFVCNGVSDIIWKSLVGLAKYCHCTRDASLNDFEIAVYVLQDDFGISHFVYYAHSVCTMWDRG